jgi:hypothetical protein
MKKRKKSKDSPREWSSYCFVTSGGMCLTLKKVDTIVNKNGENQKETEEIQSRRKNGDGEASLSRRRKSK